MKTTKQIQKFKNYLETHSLRLTRERQLILEQSFSFSTHFRADDLLFQMISNSHKTSKATIYRTLPLLVKSGLLTEIIDANNNILYETVHGNASQHAHLICIRCSQITEFQDPEIERRQKEICGAHQFEALKYRYEILGYCSQCKQ